MTRSSNQELVTPFDEPERVLHSTRKLFKTTSLDYSSLPKFDLFSDHENRFEEEVAKTMTESTMEEYMTNPLGGSGNEDANEHIEEVLEVVDLFHIPEVTQDQIMLRDFPMSLSGAASRWLRNKPDGSIIT
ncbi:hypothetical protein Tco_1129582 [Tanacetum coccineum]